MPDDLAALTQRRWRMAVLISVGMVVLYFGFILLIAFNKPFLAVILTPGLSMGILLGALVIACTWIVTWFYIHWANRHVDTALVKLKSEARR